MSRFLRCCFGVLLSCSLVLPAAADDWVWLFNGENLDGWTKRGGDATYAVVDGAIVGTNGPGHNTFLCTNAIYSNFELEFDVRLENPLNSGVQIRSNVRHEEGRGDAEFLYGPQIEIEQGPGEAGYVYGERIGGWLTPEAERVPHSLFENEGWNHYRIVARGPRIQTYVNGRQVADLWMDDRYDEHWQGFIGLQVHSTNAPTGSQHVAWKNIRLREIETNGWIPLFNGNNLDGWTPKVRGRALGEDPDGHFRVEDGLLKSRPAVGKRFDDTFGHLFFEQPFKRYRIRAEYRLVGEQANGGPGWAFRNNGLMLHSQPPETMTRDQDFPRSIEVQLLGGNGESPRTTANLCTPGTKVVIDGVLREEHCINSASPTYHGDQWVQVEVEVLGSDGFVHYINGDEVMRYDLPQADDGTLIGEGYIAIQYESHPTDFRYIEVMPLDE